MLPVAKERRRCKILSRVSKEQKCCGCYPFESAILFCEPRVWQCMDADALFAVTTSARFMERSAEGIFMSIISGHWQSEKVPTSQIQRRI